ncbi:MAG: T9SS type A sorting domain-containing protein, partial [Bacteroidia bacterium]|nr:T9SS type A sorting domain-containing protein [Bacteroidia bacterium]
NGTIWTSIWSQTLNQGDQWNSQSVDISNYIGGGVQLRFNRITGGTWRADVAIDNIAVSGTMSSAPPFSSNGTLDILQNGDNFIPTFTLYPNPVRQGVLYFSMNTAMTAYSVYNVSGQRLLSGGIGTDFIDVSKLNTGVYFIEFTTDYGNVIGQFIVE